MTYTTSRAPALSTPWGAADHIEPLAGEHGEHLLFADTPGHGGFAVPDEWVQEHPLARLVKSPSRIRMRDTHWFEEDCGWAALPLLDKAICAVLARAFEKDEESLRDMAMKTTEKYMPEFHRALTKAKTKNT